MIPKMSSRVADSSAVTLGGYRPPKSPSSNLLPAKTLAAPPTSPRRRKPKTVSHESPKQHRRTLSDVSQSLSPTSVVDTKGLECQEQQSSREKDRSRDKRRRDRRPGKHRSGISDQSLIDAAHNCIKVRGPWSSIAWIIQSVCSHIQTALGV